MAELTRRGALKAVGALGVGLVSSGTALGTTFEATRSSRENETGVEEGLVGTWATAHHPPVPDDFSSQGIEDQTLRQVVHTSVGGDELRLRLSNVFGEQRMTIESVTVGIRDRGAAVSSGTLADVTFGGSSRVEIEPGARAYSDPVPLSVLSDQDLVVSFYAPDSTGPVSWHNFGKNQSYLTSGDSAGDESGDAFSEHGEAYYLLDGVDVVNSDVEGAVVALGDSITDGAGSTVGANETYPDHLARRINIYSMIARYADRDEVTQKSVLNAGLNGNRLLTDGSVESAFGPSGLNRLERDVLAQTGVSDVVLLLGINDILHDILGITEPVTADDIIDGMRQIIDRSHDADVRVIGGTITPILGALQGTVAENAEETRQAVNEFVRTSGEFDGVVDFAAALEDPDNSGYLKPEYDSGDDLHPGDEGYRAMAAAFDLGTLINW